MRFHFPIIIIDEDFRSENTSGLGIRALAKAIEEEGMEVLGVTSYGDLTSFAQQQSRGSTFILSIDDEEFSSPEAAAKAIADLRAFVEEIRPIPEASAHAGGTFVGRSPAFVRLVEMMRRVAGSDTPVLLLGESGTGKELAASAIHDASPRARARARPSGGSPTQTCSSTIRCAG